MENNYKRSYKSTDRELVSLSVYNVGFEKCNAFHQWGPGIRDHYLIHYIISGNGYYRFNDKEVKLGAGDCFLVYPNTEVSYKADSKEPWEYSWTGFTGSDASMILQATDFTREKPYLKNIPYGEQIKQQMLHIYDARGNEFEHAVEMTGCLYTMLAVFMHNAAKRELNNTTNSYVQKSIEYISANYSYPITIEDIAAYIGLSRSQLFRSFRQVLNLSPKEYLTEFRIKQACFLLEHSELSITAIANSVGFDNSLYFSKAFHKEKGTSPKTYRKSTIKQI